ncbi:hypothetical protein HDV00_010135 [Rhizophlyctis rosea]|nr:hypothetical protein HDV00_010135 [Rhizophlyctis rosea]
MGSPISTAKPSANLTINGETATFASEYENSSCGRHYNIFIDYILPPAIKYAGPGCPSDTAAILLSANKQSFLVIFDDYAVTLEPGKIYERKTCQLEVDFGVLGDGRFHVNGTINNRGAASVDRGVVGDLMTGESWEGDVEECDGGNETRCFDKSGVDERFVVSRSVEVDYLGSGDRLSLKLSSTLLLDNSRNKRGTGYVTVDSGEIE